MLNKVNFLVVLFLAVCCSLKAQQTPAELISKKIADKMTDSLSLTASQHDTLYTVNLRLQNLKTAMRQQYQGSDSLRYKMQQVENTRDALYLPVLGSDKYSLYLSKKRNLVNNN